MMSRTAWQIIQR